MCPRIQFELACRSHCFDSVYLIRSVTSLQNRCKGRTPNRRGLNSVARSSKSANDILLVNSLGEKRLHILSPRSDTFRCLTVNITKRRANRQRSFTKRQLSWAVSRKSQDYCQKETDRPKSVRAGTTAISKSDTLANVDDRLFWVP